MNRRAIAISGIVQGVGFRPFVFDLANRLGLRGFVRNQAGGVRIEVEGESQFLDRFVAEVQANSPPLARIDELSWTDGSPRGDLSFRIDVSRLDHEGPIFISPDVAPCNDCLRELFDPDDRRYCYPFLNCTNCGPRLSIIRGAPYDRERTTMSMFAMCLTCRAEYEDPANRRFHAQPTACPACGPRLILLDGNGLPLHVEDPLNSAIVTLERGGIVAIKGLGGYHLACLANNAKAVAELRKRKERDDKPFAIMVPDLDTASALCIVSSAEAELLESPRRPIVLLRRRERVDVALEVAPGNPTLGVMLPSTPLHHLIFHDNQGQPLVMTSGNRSDEPIAFQDGDAASRLAGICDLFLTHDRPIHLRCDDSVTRIVSGRELPIRRSRGDTPLPLELSVPCRIPILALGGQMKVTFALGRDRHAFVSHHIGDLDHYEAYRSYVEAIGHYEKLFELHPELIVHDLHPDYPSTRYAVAREVGDSTIRLAVQHHHAHLASCMADNRIEGPVIGVIFDGTGYGTDGTVWGGEFLIGDYFTFRRAAHFRTVAMPGGEQAIREPWRMAAAYLADADCDDRTLRNRLTNTSLTNVRRQIERNLNSPLTSSAGRLFDAVASIAGVRDQVTFEGQAAMELEWLAGSESHSGSYAFEFDKDTHEDKPLVIDARPVIVEVAEDAVRGIRPAIIARRFHSALVDVVAAVCASLRSRTGIDRVAISGGVFQNALLTAELIDQLGQDGFQTFRHRRVPPGDGGLSLGQIAIAAARNVPH